MHNKTKTKHKIILKLSTNDNESNVRHKKTRKMKGGFFGLFNKSSSPPQRAVVNPSQQVQQPVTNVASAAIQTSVGVTVINTLSTIVSTALGRPEVMAAVTGIAATSVAVASGGLIVIGAVVLMSAIFIVREKRKAYNGLILVMDELFLVLQKLSGIADVSMHIAEVYGFPIDTRDVNIALNTILTKFDELLDPTDYGTIKNDLTNFGALKKKANGAVNMIIDDAAIRQTAQDSNNATTEPPLSLWTKFNNQRKQIFFSAPKFVEELNESVAYLALYVGAFSASFSTTYTTVVVQLLINNQMDELRALQTKVLNDIKFHSMLEGALVYPLLQSQKTRATCLNRNPASSCDPTFYNAATSMLSYMQTKFGKSNGVSSALYAKMPNLKHVVEMQTTPLSTAADANAFANKVKEAFDADRGDINSALKPPTPAPPAPPARTPQPPEGDIELTNIAPPIEMTEFKPKTPATTAAAAPATNPQPPATNPQPPATTTTVSPATNDSATNESDTDPLNNGT
jgi:hypothetical protein